MLSHARSDNIFTRHLQRKPVAGTWGDDKQHGVLLALSEDSVLFTQQRDGGIIICRCDQAWPAIHLQTSHQFSAVERGKTTVPEKHCSECFAAVLLRFIAITDALTPGVLPGVHLSIEVYRK